MKKRSVDLFPSHICKPIIALLSIGVAAGGWSTPTLAQETGEATMAETSRVSGASLVYQSDLQRTGYTDVTLGSAPNLLWRHSLELEPKKDYDVPPIVAGPPGQRRIYFAFGDVLFCIDGQTGAQIWRSKPLSRPVSSPISLLATDSGDVLLAVTSSGELNALRTSDGGAIWQSGTGTPVQNVAPFFLKTANGPRIVLALATGRLIAFDLQGQLDPTWEVKLGSLSTTPLATPAISPDGQFLYIPTQDKRLYVVNIPAARVEFPIAQRVAEFSSPIVLDDQLFAATGTTLTGMKLRTGQTQWVFDQKTELGSPAAKKSADGSLVFVGGRNGKFYAVNAGNGRLVWQTDLADSVSGTPTVTNDMVLVGTRSGLMFGLSPTDGKIIWRYRLQSERVTEYSANQGRNDNQNGGQTDNQSRNRSRNYSPGGSNFYTTKAANATIWGDVPTQDFGVSSTPVVLDGRVYVLGNNAALYAFTTQPFDANPPEVVKPELSIPNSAAKPTLQRIDNEKPLLVSGRAPIQFTCQLLDDGSGVDPTTIRVSLNKEVLPATAIAPFSDATGKLLVTLAEQKGQVITSLDDGLYTVTLQVKDFRGNELNYVTNFLVDNTVPLPKAPVVIDTNGNNNQR